MKRLFFYFMQVILNYKRNAILVQNIDPSMKAIGDFGCGHYPNKHANILLDNLETEDEQRGGLAIRQNTPGRTFHNIDLNVFPYPFPDKYFDFLICSHVLEHLDNPVLTCQELSRIAKSGYIEVPYYCADLFVENNNAIHRWLCSFDQERRILRFFPRENWLLRLPPQKISIFMRFLLQLDNLSLVWADTVQATYSDVVEASLHG